MKDHQTLLTELNRLSAVKISLNVDLRLLSHWRIGGYAKIVAEPEGVEELASVIKLVNQYPDVPHIVIGDCSNLLFADEGFDGLIIRVADGLNRLEFDDNKVYCEAGVWVPELAYRSYREGLSGIEHICGIPGRLGGLVYMNGGSNRRSISENLESIVIINSDGEVKRVDPKTLPFTYRSSPFQNMDVIIAAATLILNKSERNEVRNIMRKTLASRRRKFPRKQPNCGSVFASNPAMYETVGPPGYAVEKIGLKGHQIGEAQISPRHANFIVNLGQAKAKDVLSLIKLARDKVYQDTNFYMDCEVRYVFPNGGTCKAHEVDVKR